MLIARIVRSVFNTLAEIVSRWFSDVSAFVTDWLDEAAIEAYDRNRSVYDDYVGNLPYKRDPYQCLTITVELSGMTRVGASMYQAAAEASAKRTGRIRADQVCVVVRSLQDLTFDEVHCGEVPAEWETTPLVIEMNYCEQERCIVNLRVALVAVDGVTALHTLWNVIEHLEGKELTKYPFAESNQEKYNKSHLRNLRRKLWNVCCLTCDIPSALFTPGRWAPNPWMITKTSLRERQIGCYVTRSDRYKELINNVEKLRANYDVKVSSTVNYPPHYVGVTYADNMEQLTKQRTKFLALPPGVPPPAWMLGLIGTDTIFFNNYGRHNPNIKATVTNFCWDWMGLPRGGSPAIITMSIQDRLFVCTHLPADCTNTFDETLAIVSNNGGGGGDGGDGADTKCTVTVAALE